MVIWMGAPLQADFWGVVIPAYMAAVGGVISALVGAFALVLSLRNKGSVQSITNGLNADQETVVTNVHATAGTLPMSAGLTATGVAHAFVTWGVERDGRRYRLVNRSNTHPALLTSAQDVGDGGDKAFYLLMDLPVSVDPGGSIPFNIEKSLVSAAVTAIRLTWDEEDRGTQSVTLYI